MSTIVNTDFSNVLTMQFTGASINKQKKIAKDAKDAKEGVRCNAAPPQQHEYTAPADMNCEYIDVVQYVTSSGTFGGTTTCARHRCTFKAITNSVNIIAGTELVLRIAPDMPHDDTADDPPTKKRKQE